MANQEYHIVAGPNKFDLMVALFYKPAKTSRQPVTFILNILHLSPNGKVENTDIVETHVVINKIEWEDGSGQSWNFTGYSVSSSETMTLSGPVKGTFNTQTRRGMILPQD